MTGLRYLEAAGFGGTGHRYRDLDMDFALEVSGKIFDAGVLNKRSWGAFFVVEIVHQIALNDESFDLILFIDVGDMNGLSLADMAFDEIDTTGLTA